MSIVVSIVVSIVCPSCVHHVSIVCWLYISVRVCRLVAKWVNE